MLMTLSKDVNPISGCAAVIAVQTKLKFQTSGLHWMRADKSSRAHNNLDEVIK